MSETIHQFEINYDGKDVSQQLIYLINKIDSLNDSNSELIIYGDSILQKINQTQLELVRQVFLHIKNKIENKDLKIVKVQINKNYDQSLYDIANQITNGKVQWVINE